MKRGTYFRKPLIFETHKACGEIHKHRESESTLGFYEPIATAHLGFMKTVPQWTWVNLRYELAKNMLKLLAKQYCR